MSDALKQYKEECEEMKLAAMIWWLILWYASDEGKLELPSEQEWLACELVAALFEKVTGVELWFSWRHNIAGNECQHDWNEWPPELNEMLRMIDERDRSVYGKIIVLLKQFVRYNFQAAQNEKDWHSELRTFHEGCTPRPSRCPCFKPQREMYVIGLEELLRYTSAHHAEVCAWCRDVGGLMHKYIERDISYIKRHRPL